jgi:hypothetical protein
LYSVEAGKVLLRQPEYRSNFHSLNVAFTRAYALFGVCGAVLGTFASPAYLWGSNGHEIVAAIASLTSVTLLVNGSKSFCRKAQP